MSRLSMLVVLAGACLLGCWGGERTRPETPTPARAPFSPDNPIPPVRWQRPPPPPAPQVEAAPGEAVPPGETAPEREPPAGQLGGGTGDD